MCSDRSSTTADRLPSTPTNSSRWRTLAGESSTLTDLDGGTDWIDAAAVTGALVLNLDAGASGSIGASWFTIAGGTIIENVTAATATTSSPATPRQHPLWRARRRHADRRRRRRPARRRHRRRHRGVLAQSRELHGARSRQPDRVSGRKGSDTLFGIEHLQFADGTVDSRRRQSAVRHAVLHAAAIRTSSMPAIDALAAFQRLRLARRARSRTRFFDISGYLAVNHDVAAAGINPLDHYHADRLERRARSVGRFRHHALSAAQSGRRGGRHRSARALSCSTGRPRGAPPMRRSATTSSGGFDAQYYLLHNPDVAAAGVDPLLHYNTVGWHEGRNPNALFRHRGLSRALRRRRGRGHQPAASTTRTSAGRRAATRRPASTPAAISRPIRTSRRRTSTRSTTS